MKEIDNLFLAAWPFISVVISFSLGVGFTRWILTPRYCPRCQMYLAWNEDRKVEAKKLAKTKNEKPN